MKREGFDPRIAKEFAEGLEGEQKQSRRDRNALSKAVEAGYPSVEMHRAVETLLKKLLKHMKGVEKERIEEAIKSLKVAVGNTTVIDRKRGAFSQESDPQDAEELAEKLKASSDRLQNDIEDVQTAEASGYPSVEVFQAIQELKGLIMEDERGWQPYEVPKKTEEVMEYRTAIKEALDEFLESIGV